jgi:hypothetical protein
VKVQATNPTSEPVIITLEGAGATVDGKPTTFLSAVATLLGLLECNYTVTLYETTD